MGIATGSQPGCCVSHGAGQNPPILWWHAMAGHMEQCSWLLGCPHRGAEPHPGLCGVGKDLLQPCRDRQGLTPAVAVPGTTSMQRNRPPPG